MGIYRKVAKAVPELGLTYERFCQIDGEYRKAHPKYQTWYDATVKVVSADRCLKNAFGRIRYFLGSNEEILREGLNFPIQSTGADVLNMAIIRISKANLKAELIASVHDSLVLEVSEKFAKREALLIKKLMEVPVAINGKDISFPVDMEMGPNWGSMQKIEF
jgi:DNA polymerase I-like protein with 3'-5' exonuclease and polymerase domains